MSEFAAKLAFAHRKLWQRDPTYRAAILLGPPPVLGALIGAAIWAATHTAQHAQTVLGWAVPSSAPVQNDKPRAEAPVARLPPADAQGGLHGFTPGWYAGIHRADVTPTLDVNVQDDTLFGFMLDTPDIDMARIVREAPKTGRFVGVEGAALAIRSPGHTTLAVRIDRAGGSAADCLVRLAVNRKRVVSSFEVNLPPFVSKTLDPVEFDFQPGLYKITVGFGCWHGEEMVDTVRLSLLIRHPGDPGLEPARGNEILRPSRAETK